MTAQDLLEQFRSDMSDVAQPPLWSDPEVLRYFVAAQDRMITVMGGIADVTEDAADAGVIAGTRLADLVLVTDSPYSAVSPYILRVRSGRLLTAAKDIIIGQEADMADVLVRDYGWSQGTSFDDTDTGVVTHGILGVRSNYVRWVRVPSSDDTCRLHVLRLPYPRATTWNDAVVQVAEEHQLSLVTGMRAFAYMKQDAETVDRKMAESMRAEFEGYCDRARRELERKQYRPRVTKYGGP